MFSTITEDRETPWYKTTLEKCIEATNQQLHGCPVIMLRLHEVCRINKSNFDIFCADVDRTIQHSLNNGDDFKAITAIVTYDDNASPLKMASFKMWTKIILHFQREYPNRLHRCYLVRFPRAFRTFFTFIRPFIDKQTQQKIVFQK